jgi:hypothetical protein
LPVDRANAGAIEPVSPELVLVCPELRTHAPYGPYVPRRPAYIEPLGTARSGDPLARVELTLRLPVLGVAIVASFLKALLQAGTIILGAVLLVTLLVLLARL